MTSRSRTIRLLILLLLAPAVVLPLLVGLYDRVVPTLFDFPFFFWFQMLLIVLCCLVTGIAYFLAEHADRLDRRTRADHARGDEERR